MRDCDCLVIGYNDINFEDFVNMIKSMGTDHEEYKNLNLNFIQYNNKPYRALETLTHFYFRDSNKNEIYKPFHNNDILYLVVAYLCTYLARRGFTFDYANPFHLQKDRLKEKLAAIDYLTVAITTTNYIFDLPILDIISFIRKYNDTAKIIVGGPYISKRSETMEPGKLKSFFKHMGADFYVYSREGEQALVNIIKALKNKGDFDHIDNIAYRNGSDYIITPGSVEINPLEENMPDYSLFPGEDVGNFVNLRFSKGCPYRCSFCGFPIRTQKYMYTGVECVEKELNALRHIGTITHLFFIDDTFNVPKERFKAILRMMIRQQYNFRWHCFFRCDKHNYDEETIELMKKAGCQGVFLGVESANDTVLKNMNKTARKQDYLNAIPLLKKAGILVFVSLIIGFPGETIGTFQETLDFLEKTRPDFYRPQLWYCEPVTPIWQQREKHGLTGYHFSWSHNTMDAKTAADLFEKAFFSVDTPTWVPDLDYGFVALYYLEQRGMSFQKQKTFLKCFNAIIKEKLLYPDKGKISPHLLENLKKSCQFNRPGEPDMRRIEMFSASRYKDDETFWINQFKNPVHR